MILRVPKKQGMPVGGSSLEEGLPVAIPAAPAQPQDSPGQSLRGPGSRTVLSDLSPEPAVSTVSLV